jgi:hypothetical protein
MGIDARESNFPIGMIHLHRAVVSASVPSAEILAICHVESNQKILKGTRRNGRV